MITDDDTEYRRLARELDELAGVEVRVGIFDDESATVLAAHEYGTDTVPQRPVLGPTIDEHRDELDRAKAKVLDGVIAGTETPERGAKKVGALAAALAQERVRSNVPPPLQPETIARKGSSKTLIDTGAMLGAISYEVGAKGAR